MVTEADPIRLFADAIGVSPPVVGARDVQAALAALALGDALKVPSALVGLTSTTTAYAVATYLTVPPVAGGSVVLPPQTIGVGGLVIASTVLSIVHLAAFVPLLDTNVDIWASDAAGTNQWRGTIVLVGTDHPSAALTKAQVTQSVLVGVDLSVPGAAGDQFTLVSAAGGFFTAGASINIVPN